MGYIQGAKYSRRKLRDKWLESKRCQLRKEIRRVSRNPKQKSSGARLVKGKAKKASFLVGNFESLGGQE